VFPHAVAELGRHYGHNGKQQQVGDVRRPIDPNIEDWLVEEERRGRNTSGR